MEEEKKSGKVGKGGKVGEMGAMREMREMGGEKLSNYNSNNTNNKKMPKWKKMLNKYFPSTFAVSELVFRETVKSGNDSEMSGWLLKRGNVLKNWKRRFFKLFIDKRVLTYHIDPIQNQALGSIHISHIISVQQLPQLFEEKQFVFSMKVSSPQLEERTFYFSAETEGKKTQQTHL